MNSRANRIEIARMDDAFGVLKGEASYDTLGDAPHPKAILVDAGGVPGQTLKNRILLETYYLHHGHVTYLSIAAAIRNPLWSR